MNQEKFSTEVSKCVRCGTCKSLCPTYLASLNESMGARGRVAMLGELCAGRLAPSKTLADRIYNCILCGSCKGLCPLGIDIPELMFHGRSLLKDSHAKGRFAKKGLRYSVSNMDTLFSLLRLIQKVYYGRGHGSGILSHMPLIASVPLKNRIQLYKNRNRAGRAAIFTGCSVNYLYPHIGESLIRILLAKRYEVVVFKGEVCCGAPMREAGLENEAKAAAKKNIETFNKTRAEAVISMCPTCTMTIREQYPALAGESITNIMDVNEFFINSGITERLELPHGIFTYHDPCHARYGTGITKEPREILKGIQGIEFVEMKHADGCCGFGGLFSMHYKELSRTIGKKKFENIKKTAAGTVVTSCPGCIMQLEYIKREAGSDMEVKHIVEIVDKAMQG
ncbi:MAG: (Fe-S)-binding protein [Nitrospirae bacterium]|nr:(Fe-S)-binding protein [Nitrospirota bacterium]